MVDLILDWFCVQASPERANELEAAQAAVKEAQEIQFKVAQAAQRAAHVHTKAKATLKQMLAAAARTAAKAKQTAKAVTSVKQGAFRKHQAQLAAVKRSLKKDQAAAKAIQVTVKAAKARKARAVARLNAAKRTVWKAQKLAYSAARSVLRKAHRALERQFAAIQKAATKAQTRYAAAKHRLATARAVAAQVKAQIKKMKAAVLSSPSGFTSYDQLHMGCFADQANARDLKTALGESDTMTVARCHALATEARAVYFAVQAGRQCYGGSSYGRFGASKNCDALCSDDMDRTCGGNLANQVFFIGTTKRKLAAALAKAQTLVTKRVAAIAKAQLAVTRSAPLAKQAQSLLAKVKKQVQRHQTLRAQHAAAGTVAELAHAAHLARRAVTSVHKMVYKVAALQKQAVRAADLVFALSDRYEVPRVSAPVGLGRAAAAADALFAPQPKAGKAAGKAGKAAGKAPTLTTAAAPTMTAAGMTTRSPAKPLPVAMVFSTFLCFFE